MSYKHAPTHIYKTSEVLSDDTKLSSAVRQVLSLPSREAEGLIGSTTSTAYRRIHEHLTAVFDRAVEVLSRPESGRVSEVVVGLTKGLILVEYQLSRNQVSRELGIRLREILESLLESLNQSEAGLAKKFERARTLLDALAVLVYRYTR